MSVMMKCGHAANARRSDGTPVCAICIGIGNLGGDIVDDSPPDLSGRQMRCSYARDGDTRPSHQPRPSSTDAAFFEHRPDRPYDRFYCGCYGWD